MLWQVVGWLEPTVYAHAYVPSPRSRCSIAWLGVELGVRVRVRVRVRVGVALLDRRARGAAEEQLEPLAANTARLARRVARDDGEARLLARRRLPGSGLGIGLTLTTTSTLTPTLTLTPKRMASDVTLYLAEGLLR